MLSKKDVNYFLKNSPFSSRIYEQIWSRHYLYKEKTFKFESFQSISFIKSKIPLTYINVGKNLTSGIYYKTQEGENDYKKKVFFIRDIPSYYGLSDKKKFSTSLKFKPIKQYKGFLADIRNFTSVNDYLRTLVSSRRIRYYKKCLRKIDENKNISYKVFYGSISKENHEFIVNHYDRLMHKRYSAKGEKIIGDSKQSNFFFKEISFALINDKKAILQVLYNNKTPIGILFSYVSNKVVHASRIVIDMSFSNYGLGHILLYKELQWAFDNKFAIVDYTKIEYPYKYKWCNYKYSFDFHFWYDSNYLPSVVIAHTLASFFWFLQFLRGYNIHNLYHRILFYFNNSKNDIKVKPFLPISR